MAIAVKRIGSAAPTRVLLHGFASSSGTFLQLLPFLSRHGSLLLVDLPAHGHSSVPLEDPDPAAMARAVVDVLVERRVDSFQLIGHSLGALVATHVAIAMSDRLEGLCLISCAGIGREINVSFFRSLIAAQSAIEVRSILSVAHHSAPNNLAQVSGSVFSWLQKPGVRGYLSRISLDGSFAADMPEVIARGIPVSVLWGAKDNVLPVANARRLPSSVPVVVLPDAGHAPHMEAPAEVARWILAAPRRRAPNTARLAAPSLGPGAPDGQAPHC